MNNMKIMKKLLFAIVFAIFFLLLLLQLALATFGPRAFITEYVLVDYHPNGSIDTTNLFLPCNFNPCRYGVVEVSVPNNDDVLQQVKINLSSTANTNLQSNVAYKNFLISYPTANSKQNISVNTTQADPAEYYNLTNSNVAPAISLSITVRNLAGGNDLFDDDNILIKNNTVNFTLNASNSGTIDLNNSNIIVQFKKDSFGSSDVINVTNLTCSTGSCSREDSDSDGYFDRVVWNVNLTQSSSAIIQFNGTTTSGINFPDADSSINLDSNDKGVTANYSNVSTFTGMSIVKKFAKSSLSQGVDMVQNSSSGTWLVRGYIMNMGNLNVDSGEHVLTYNVTSWRLYTINQTTGAPLQNVQNGTFTSAAIAPNDILYTTDSKSSNTTWYDSGSTTKPFYGSYFEWEVIWNSTNSENYLSFSNSTLDLPTLYKIDMVNDKSLSGSMLPNTAGDVVTITDTVRHSGSSNLPTDFIQILSVVPVNTTVNEFHGWFDVNSTSVKFYFDNTTLGGSSYELQTGVYATINVNDPANNGSYNGLVNLTIINLTGVSFITGGVVGHGLRPNEKIKLVFDVLDNESMTVDDTYNFTGNSSLKTQSGTPLTEYQPAQTISVTAVAISLPVNSINFGTMNLNDTNDTLDSIPQPFIIQNDGSVSVNITIEATNLWSDSGAANPSSYYRFQSAENETGSVPSTSDLVTTWTNIASIGNAIKFATRLNYTDSNDTLKGHLYVLVPSEEAGGAKSSEIIFTAAPAS